VERVAVIYQPVLDDAKALAERCADYVARSGREAQLYSSWDLGPALPTEGLKLAITLGGDGTILRVARWLAASDVPIVGVKMGRLGFLAELLPGELFDCLDPYLAGDFWLDARTMLRAEMLPAGGATRAQAVVDGHPDLLALNDVVVSRGAAGRAVRAAVEVDGTELVSYTADGIIVATATGSTAYSFAAGGPILAPDLPNLIVTAICPHVHGLGGLVLPPDVTVTVRIWTPLPAGLTCDGHTDLPMFDGEGAAVRAAAERTLFARRARRSTFYRSIIDKLPR
jgi:NAD+ kinase